MKTFCTNCGKGISYIGPANKPKSCPNCKFSFVSKAEAVEAEDEDYIPTEGYKEPKPSYTIEGSTFDIKSLLSAISIDDE